MTRLYRCVMNVPIEMHIHARDRDTAMSTALNRVAKDAPGVELYDGQRFFVTKLATEVLDDDTKPE